MSSESSDIFREMVSLLQQIVDHNHQLAARQQEIAKSLGNPPDFKRPTGLKELTDKFKMERIETEKRRQDDKEFQANMLAELQKQTALRSQLLSKLTEPD